MKNNFEASIFESLVSHPVEWYPAKCKKPLVSIIVYYHFGSKDMAAFSVYSALAQKNMDLEVIVIDDASACGIAPPSEPHVGLLKYRRMVGQARAIQEAINYSRGSYVKIMNYDTMFSGDILSKQVEHFMLGKTECSYSKVFSIYRDSIVDDTDPLNVQGGLFLKEKIDGVVPEDFYTGYFDALWYMTKDLRRIDIEEVSVNCEQDKQHQFYDKRSIITSNNIQRMKRYLDYKKLDKIKIAILDNNLAVTGAQWSAIQWGKIMHQDGFDVRFFVAYPGKLLSYARALGIECEVWDRKGDFFDWLNTKITLWKPNIIDVAWNGDLITDNFRRIADKVFYHLQNVDIHWMSKERPLHDKDNFIAVSDAVYEAFPYVQHKCISIPSPVDIKMGLGADRKIARYMMGFSEEDIVITWSGRVMAPEKRIDIVKDIAPKLSGVRFALASIFNKTPYEISGGISLEAYLADTFRDGMLDWCGKNNSVLIEDLMPWHSPIFYSAGDIHLSVSDVEGLSLATVEAIASKLPVVSTNAGGQQEVIVDEVNGKIVETGDEKGIIEALAPLISATFLQRQVAGNYGFDLVNSKCDVYDIARSTVLGYMS